MKPRLRERRAGRLAAHRARLASAYARTARPRFVRELAEFVRFPSVSGEPRHAPDVRRCARWLANHLRGIGLHDTQIVRTRGNPIVVASWRRAPAATTLLIYGHYDVQPAEKVNDWQQPPFEPAVRAGALYGRGASDDKGQMFVHLKALECYLRTSGALPVNVVCVFEGEEEIGSPNLRDFLRAHRAASTATAAVISDTPMLAPDRPTITESLRGALSVEIEVRGPRADLHSGNFGGAILNPLQVLCDIVASLHDARGAISIPGFYDRVLPLSRDERSYMARRGPTDAKILRDAGATRGWGEPGFSLYERMTARPALSVNGIVGGYQGPGAKAVIPACALAKISMRLVEEQSPDEIERLLRKHVASRTPPGAHIRIRTLFSAHPFSSRRQSALVRAAAAAYRAGFGAWPTFMRIGGTIPAAHLFARVLRVPTVLMGFALPDDGMHGPNERFRLANFFRGIESSIRLLARLASQ
jgi:acetylornithine deacetylase/succinyl-diaminopimelate desuccinylase-like protein